MGVGRVLPRGHQTNEQLSRKCKAVAWSFSSGDLSVDRRLAFAEGMAHAGDLPAAIEVVQDAMGLVPDWAAGWFKLAEWHEEAGHTAAAIAAWDRALAADPADTLGAGLKRDLARAVPLAETMPPRFVETLFDQYAENFDHALVGQLDYRAPSLLHAALARQRFGRVMDLGCGTGLAGQVFRPQCDWLEGCDISAGMLAQAQAKGVYDRLFKADLATLGIAPAPYDLIIAADVFVYVGALEHVAAWCAGSLAPGGMLAFTVEASDDAPLVLRESRRFAHSQGYVSDLLTAAGFSAVTVTRVALRQDRGAMIEGFAVVAGGLTVGNRQGDGEGMVPA